MKNKKMILWVVLIVIAIIPIYAQQYDSEKDFKIDSDPKVKGGVVITGYIGSKNEVRIPPSIQNKPVTGIGDKVFLGDPMAGSDFTKIIIPNSVKSIGDWAFALTSFTSITIPNSVTSIGLAAFSTCELTSIIIPDSVTSIGEQAFYECHDLASITIGNGVTSIGEETFAYCDSLISVTIGSGVTSIDDSAFSSCSALTAINVNSNNTAYSSQDGVLYNKTKTKLLYLPEGKKGAITIPNSVTSIEDSAFSYCPGLTAINVNSNNTAYSSQDGVLYNKTKTTLLYFPKGKTGAFTIPDSVTSIWKNAFRGASLTSVTIGNGVTGIESEAFYYCGSLTSVTIPKNVTSIGNSAFDSCTSLTSVKFERAGITIGASAFVSKAITTSLQTAYTSGGIGTYTRPSTTSLTFTKKIE